MANEYERVIVKIVDNISNYVLQPGEVVFCKTNNVLYFGDKNCSNTLIQAGSEYILPTATASVLGGVKIGSRITISSGSISADVQSTNDFTTALKNKLDGIEASATKYPDTGEQAFTDADHTKLDGIEAGAVAPSYLVYTALMNQTLGVPDTLDTLVGGTGYVDDTGVATTGGTGTGLTLDITVEEGIITSAIINTPGSGYTALDTVGIVGGNSDATINVATITNPVVATVLENALGDTVVWTVSGTGAYAGTLAGAFRANKTVTSLLNRGNIDTPATSTILMIRNDEDTIHLNTYSDAYTTPADGVLSNTPIEIRVYP